MLGEHQGHQDRRPLSGQSGHSHRLDKQNGSVSTEIIATFGVVFLQGKFHRQNFEPQISEVQEKSPQGQPTDLSLWLAQSRWEILFPSSCCSTANFFFYEENLWQQELNVSTEIQPKSLILLKQQDLFFFGL